MVHEFPNEDVDVAVNNGSDENEGALEPEKCVELFVSLGGFSGFEFLFYIYLFICFIYLYSFYMFLLFCFIFIFLIWSYFVLLRHVFLI